MIPIILAILALGILIIIHEAGHFIVARLCNMRVDKFSLGFGPAIWKKKIGETTYQIGAIPLGGFVQIAGLSPDEEGHKETDPNDPRLYNNRPAWQRFLAVLAGPAINYLVAGLIFTGIFFYKGTPPKGAIVAEVVAQKPAAVAGILPGDELLEINGFSARRYDRVSGLIQLSEGKPVSVFIQRNGNKLSFQVNPFLVERQVQLNGEVKKEKVWVIGLTPGPKEMGKEKLNMLASVAAGFYEPIQFTVDQITYFKFLFQGKGSFKAMGGPVQIVRQLKEGIHTGWLAGLSMIAVISAALGFMNLFPIPALDGGRLVFLGIEIITRRPINQRIEQIVHVIGFILLLGLLLLITAKDIFALFSS